MFESVVQTLLEPCKLGAMTTALGRLLSVHHLLVKNLSLTLNLTLP